MLNYVLVLTLLVSSGCGKFKRDNEPQDPIDPLEVARVKASLYADRASDSYDARGFLHSHCDSLLFTALHSVALGDARRDTIMSARDAAGRWHRHPDMDCFVNGQDNGSKSTISNDMLLGLLWWAWEFRERDVVVGVIDYGKSHNWNMGDGDPFRTIMRPTLIALYYDVARELGADPGPTPTSLALKSDGESYCGWTGQPDDVCGAKLQDSADSQGVPTDFEAHLQVLHKTLRAHALGGASDVDVQTFKAQSERQPGNALFQAAYHLYTDGDQSAAASVLADDKFFPPDRLPTVDDRCVENLWEHDMSEKNVAPCPGQRDRPHSGTDLMLALKMSENRLRKRNQ